MTRKERQKGEAKYRKSGGGSFRLLEKIIKPGQVFYAKPEDIPEAFKDVLDCLDDIQEAKEIKGGPKTRSKLEKTLVIAEYALKLNEGASTKEKPLYDIISGEGDEEKVINESPLTKEDAEATIEALK